MAGVQVGTQVHVRPVGRADAPLPAPLASSRHGCRRPARHHQVAQGGADGLGRPLIAMSNGGMGMGRPRVPRRVHSGASRKAGRLPAPVTGRRPFGAGGVGTLREASHAVASRKFTVPFARPSARMRWNQPGRGSYLHTANVSSVGSIPSSPVTQSLRAPSPRSRDLRVCSLLPACLARQAGRRS